MKRSKLEVYVDILNVLVHGGPLKLTHIMNQANLNYDAINECLVFLTKSEIVEERVAKKGAPFFAITQRGITVLKYFRQLTNVLPALEKT